MAIWSHWWPADVACQPNPGSMLPFDSAWTKSVIGPLSNSRTFIIGNYLGQICPGFDSKGREKFYCVQNLAEGIGNETSAAPVAANFNGSSSISVVSRWRPVKLPAFPLQWKRQHFSSWMKTATAFFITVCTTYSLRMGWLKRLLQRWTSLRLTARLKLSMCSLLQIVLIKSLSKI